jgi:uncharacterized protein (DUF342 family)
MEQQFMLLNDNDGRFSVTVSDDAMTAWGEFIPALKSGRPIVQAQIDVVLASNSIVYGIQTQAIQKAVERCARTASPLAMVPVALGIKPVNEVPPYVEMRPAFDPDKKNGITEDEKGQVDYHDFSPFTIVQADEFLAVRRPGNPGENGRNIYGEELPFEVVPRKDILAGKNIRNDKRGYYAARAGQLLLSGNVLNVEDTLVIKGSVGYATGHINFPGDIIIHGFVNDGFKLYSDGKITCRQTLDVSDVTAKGGLEVNGGIIGRQGAHIKVGADMDVRFVEHCNFFSDGDITVHSEIISSIIHTIGSVMMKEGSTIISSTIHSFHSVSAANITNRAGKVNSFYLGMDFNLRYEVEASRQSLAVLTKKRDRAQRLLDMAPESQRNDMRNAYVLTDARLALEEKKLEKLLERFYTDPKAELRVSGEIMRGTYIEICGIVLVLSAGISEAVFRLNDERNRIIMDAEEIKKAKEPLKLLFGRRRT